MASINLPSADVSVVCTVRAGDNHAMGIARPRWTLRYSVLTALLAIAVVGIGLQAYLHSARHRSQTIRRLKNDGVMFLLLDAQGNPWLEPTAKRFSLATQVFGEFHGAQVHQIELRYPERFTDEDLKQVVWFEELDWLAVSGSRITDSGLKQIAKLKRLGRLDIEGCRLSPQAVNELRHALPRTKIFSDVDEGT